MPLDKATALKMHDKVRKYWQEEQNRVETELTRLTKFQESDPDQVRALNDRLGVLKSTGMALIVSPAQNEIEQMAKLGVVADIQPAWLYLDARVLTQQFGYDRVRYFQPYKSLFARGIASVMIAHLEVPAFEPQAIPSKATTPKGSL